MELFSALFDRVPVAFALFLGHRALPRGRIRRIRRGHNRHRRDTLLGITTEPKIQLSDPRRNEGVQVWSARHVDSDHPHASEPAEADPENLS